jgi:hypothetical protein
MKWIVGTLCALQTLQLVILGWCLLATSSAYAQASAVDKAQGEHVARQQGTFDVLEVKLESINKHLERIDGKLERLATP